jgi:hypothetical protein
MQWTPWPEVQLRMLSVKERIDPSDFARGLGGHHNIKGVEQLNANRQKFLDESILGNLRDRFEDTSDHTFLRLLHEGWRDFVTYQLDKCLSACSASAEDMKPLLMEATGAGANIICDSHSHDSSCRPSAPSTIEQWERPALEHSQHSNCTACHEANEMLREESYSKNLIPGKPHDLFRDTFAIPTKMIVGDRAEMKYLRLNFTHFVMDTPEHWLADVQAFCRENMGSTSGDDSAENACASSLSRLVGICTPRSYIPNGGVIGV